MKIGSIEMELVWEEKIISVLNKLRLRNRKTSK